MLISRVRSLFLPLALAGCSSAPRHFDVTTIRSAEPVIEHQATNLIRVETVQSYPLPPIAAAKTASWLLLENWAKAKGFDRMTRFVTGANVRYELERGGIKLDVVIGSHHAHWNGLEFWLGFAPQLVDGAPMIHSLDAEKNFAPLLKTDFTPSGRTIVIDPGHGGEQYGASSVSSKITEKDFTLDWALRLRSLLTNQGWQVFLTRTNDSDISLADRVALADRVEADLFVSLHFNSTSPFSEQTGLETYCLTPKGMPSNLVRNFPDDITLDFPNNAFDAENFACALRVHRALVESVHGLDRGVRRARFMTVLRGQNRPAVLIEGGYLSNVKEARLIAQAEHRQKLAEALAKALAFEKKDLARAPEKN